MFTGRMASITSPSAQKLTITSRLRSLWNGCRRLWNMEKELKDMGMGVVKKIPTNFFRVYYISNPKKYEDFCTFYQYVIHNLCLLSARSYFRIDIKLPSMYLMVHELNFRETMDLFENDKTAFEDFIATCIVAPIKALGEVIPDYSLGEYAAVREGFKNKGIPHEIGFATLDLDLFVFIPSRQ